jgi:ubiquinone/menaquinone biosynthesis C-methylase UbiE
MRNPETTRLRAEWLPRASGDVLEVGIGSGLNLRFYSSEVRRIYGVDPSLELQQIARLRLVENPIEVEFLAQSAEERLPLVDSSIDTAVLTWTLCSIPDAANALRQIRRVLKPKGQLIFLEHGRSPARRISAWQDRLTPIWKRIGGGCHLNRQIDEIIESTGFQITEMTTCYLRGPRVMTYTYQGLARVG